MNHAKYVEKAVFALDLLRLRPRCAWKANVSPSPDPAVPHRNQYTVLPVSGGHTAGVLGQLLAMLPPCFGERGGGEKLSLVLL